MTSLPQYLIVNSFFHGTQPTELEDGWSAE